MIKILCISILGVILFSGCKNQKEEIINFEDLIPSSKRHDKSALEVDEDGEVDSMLIINKHFIENGIETLSVEDNSHNLFPDRFGPLRKEKFRLLTKTDTLNYFKWIYSDSTKVMNAFFNWMDCYGENCKSIFIGEEKNIQKAPLLIFVNDTAMIYIESNTTIDVGQWEAYHESVGYKLDWSFQLEQKRWGRLNWFTYLEEDKTPYKNEDSQ